MTRYAVRFSRDHSLAGLTQVEALALWQESLIRSGLPLETTPGRTPRPRFALAARLPEGYVSDAEWVELSLTRAAGCAEVLAALGRVLAAGVRALECREMREGEPSLSSQLKWAEYRILLGPGVCARDIEAAVSRFFAAGPRPWTEVVEGRTRSFDLLDLVDDLWVEESEGGVALGMRLDASATGTGRPDSVLAGLGVTATLEKRRTALLFSYLPEALRRWLAAGRFENSRPER